MPSARGSVLAVQWGMQSREVKVAYELEASSANALSRESRRGDGE
jgi:hypothetical protein